MQKRSRSRPWQIPGLGKLLEAESWLPTSPLLVEFHHMQFQGLDATVSALHLVPCSIHSGPGLGRSSCPRDDCLTRVNPRGGELPLGTWKLTALNSSANNFSGIPGCNNPRIPLGVGIHGRL
jgi:hypothetical protein